MMRIDQSKPTLLGYCTHSMHEGSFSIRGHNVWEKRGAKQKPVDWNINVRKKVCHSKRDGRGIVLAAAFALQIQV